jgi:hypothetical protein
LPEIDQVFRDGAAQAYLIAGAEFSIVLGMPAMLAAVAAAAPRLKIGLSPLR